MLHLPSPTHIRARRRLVQKLRASRVSGRPVELDQDEFRVMFDRITRRQLKMSADDFLRRMANGTLPDNEVAEYLADLAGGRTSG
jgi:uncharacterized protein (DUF2461 family)